MSHGLFRLNGWFAYLGLHSSPAQQLDESALLAERVYPRLIVNRPDVTGTTRGIRCVCRLADLCERCEGHGGTLPVLARLIQQIVTAREICHGIA